MGWQKHSSLRFVHPLTIAPHTHSFPPPTPLQPYLNPRLVYQAAASVPLTYWSPGEDELLGLGGCGRVWGITSVLMSPSGNTGYVISTSNPCLNPRLKPLHVTPAAIRRLGLNYSRVQEMYFPTRTKEQV